MKIYKHKQTNMEMPSTYYIQLSAWTAFRKHISISSLKVLACMHATTTKICRRVSSPGFKGSSMNQSILRADEFSMRATEMFYRGYDKEFQV